MLAPPVCALCSAPGQQGNEPWGLDLCVHCEGACEPASNPGDCPPSVDGIHCLYLYRSPVDDMVTRLKFGQELVYARVLGTLLARSRLRSGEPLPECIVPIPLHRRRLVERGFNQSREIARHAARRVGVRVEPRLLERKRATAAQSSLPAAERARNLQQAFAARTEIQVPRSVALLDDVLTTGSTAEAAARTLKAVGCGHVELWICARVLRHARPTW